MKSWSKWLVAGFAAGFLAACGGGSDSEYEDVPVLPTVSVFGGIQGISVPEGAPLKAFDYNGQQCGSTQIGSGGAYKLTANCPKGPVFLFGGVSGDGFVAALLVPDKGRNTIEGRVDLSPLTALSVYHFLGAQAVVNKMAPASGGSDGLISRYREVVAVLKRNGSGEDVIGEAIRQADKSLLQTLSSVFEKEGISVAGDSVAFLRILGDAKGFFQNYPGRQIAVMEYTIGSLIDINLAPPGDQPVLYGGVLGSALLESVVARSTQPSIPVQGKKLVFRDFEGLLAGGLCELSGSGDSWVGQCNFSGKAYSAYGTVRESSINQYLGSSRFYTISLRLFSAPNFGIFAVISGGEESEGTWIDTYGQITGLRLGTGGVSVQLIDNR